jgi:replicative DNA helicase
MSKQAKHAEPQLERQYIANLLATPPEWQREVVRSIERLDPADCVTLENQAILEAAYALIQRGDDANSITVQTELEAAGKRVPWEALLGETCFSHQLLDVAKRLGKLARARRTKRALQMALASVDDLDLDGAQEHAREAAGLVSGAEVAEISSAHATAWQAVTHVRLAEGQTKPNVIRTGFQVLDAALRIRPRTQLTIGGYTGCGKSSLMLAMALHQARDGHRPGIVSLEDDRDEWGRRLLAHMSQVDPDDLDNEAVPIETLGHIELGLREAEQCNVRFAYALNRPIGDVLKAIRALASDGCDIVYVDYIQAVFVRAKGEREDVAFREAAQAIKAECQALGVALVLGSQLKRPDGSKMFAEPTHNQLKETGNLENMSEGIVLLWKTGDDDNALQLGKVSKVKGSARRPRFKIDRSSSGAITGAWAFTQQEEPAPFNVARPSFGRRS